MPKSSSPSATIFISDLSTMADGEPHHGYQLTPELIGLLGVAAGAIIVTTYQLLVIHFCCSQMREENNIQQEQTQHEQRRQWHDVNRNFRSTTARSVNSPSYEKRIPVLKYTKECSEGTCAVCLCEFTDGEEIRLLPECAHLFHVGCIDMWLSSHSNCPLCRTDIIPRRAPLHVVPPPQDVEAPPPQNALPAPHVVILMTSVGV
ncbi:RING-H2 finger protein ATL51-like [Pyrus communis]|uniref:RING-H2 finger protein ATL51-like n=1 Tax=Pyrus communis TaxID=23211 RepID=UPI0035BF7B35